MPQTGGALVGMCVGGWTPYLLMQKGVLKGLSQGGANAAVTGGIIGGAVLGYGIMSAMAPKKKE